VLLVLVLLGGVAVADDHPDRPINPGLVGERLYNEGRYAEAAKEFIKAYELAPRPALLFDIAQSYRFAGDCSAAAAYYRKFVDAVKDAPNLDKVQKYLDQMDACVAAQEKKPEPPAPPPSPPPAPPPPSPSAVVVAPPPAAEPADPGVTKRHTGVALGIVGLAAVATGVYFTHAVGVAEDDRAALQDRCIQMAGNPTTDFMKTCAPSAYQAIDDRGQRDQTIAITTYAVGGAALAAGVALYLLGRSHGDEHIAVVPTPGGAYASVGYAF
jgi:tetratricopeptide (TPR) repeat protein